MKSAINKIGRKFGRRAHDRFSVPGTTVSWTYLDQNPLPDESQPLSDITRFGLSILTNNPPEVNTEIALRINLPRDFGLLELRGTTIYCIHRGPGLTYEYRVGVKFNPFSDADGDNPIQAQEVLEKLEELYGKRMDKQDIED